MNTTKAYIQPLMKVMLVAPGTMICGSPQDDDSVSVDWGGGDGGGHHVAGSNGRRGDSWGSLWGDDDD